MKKSYILLLVLLLLVFGDIFLYQKFNNIFYLLTLAYWFLISRLIQARIVLQKLIITCLVLAIISATFRLDYYAEKAISWFFLFFVHLFLLDIFQKEHEGN